MKPQPLPRGFIVDLDGTLCDVSALRHLLPPTGMNEASDEILDALAACPPRGEVVEFFRRMHDSGSNAVLVSERPERWRAATQEWLCANLTRPWDELVLRVEGDRRADLFIKREVFDRFGARYTFTAAIDDDPAVLAMWRQLGLNTTLVPGRVESAPAARYVEVSWARSLAAAG